MTPAKWHRLFRVLSVLAVVALVAVIALSSAKQIRRAEARGDIEVYLHGARLVLAGEDLYTTPEPRSQLYYVYLPLFAILAIPLTFVPVPVAIVFWCALNAILVWWIVTTFFRAMTGTSFSSLPEKDQWIVGFFTILLTLRAILYHLDLGQKNLFVMAVAVLGLAALSSGRSFAGGAAIALSIVIKIITLPLPIVFFVQRRRRVVAGIVCGGLAGLLLPALVLGFDRNLSYVSFWLRDIIPSVDDLRNTKYWPLNVNWSLSAQLYRFFGDAGTFEHHGRVHSVALVRLPDPILHAATRLVPVVTGLAIALYAWLYRRRDELVSLWGCVALSFCLAPVFSLMSHKHYYVMLLPAHLYVVYLWHGLQLKDRWFRGLVVASFAVATLSTTLFDFVGALMSNLGGLTWGAILLAAAIFRAAGVRGKSTMVESRISV